MAAADERELHPFSHPLIERIRELVLKIDGIQPLYRVHVAASEENDDVPGIAVRFLRLVLCEEEQGLRQRREQLFERVITFCFKLDLIKALYKIVTHHVHIGVTALADLSHRRIQKEVFAKLA